MLAKIIRKIPLFLLLIPLFPLLGALTEKDFFHFSLWLFAFLILWAVVYPLSSNMKRETVPVFQIFFSLLVFIFVFSAGFFFEFKSRGIPLVEAFFYGIFMGVLVVAVIMVLKGE